KPHPQPLPSPHRPMAESSLYRQRLEVIAEKRRLQEQIRAARRELEEEKLRVERLKRKSLRERWLMDGAAEGPQQPEDPGSKDPQSPEGQAQARIRNLEDSLFTLQSELQLLQSASTGAQHKPLGRLTWRSLVPPALTWPFLSSADLRPGQAEPDKRASLPTGLVGASPEVPSEPQEEAAGVLPPQRQVPGAVGASPEANGPCPGPSPGREQERSLEPGVVEAKGAGVVEVVWEGLRAPGDCATGTLGTSGLELEARVEEVVLEAIGDRQGAGSPELPAWVKEDRGVAEVVWEGLGGTESQAGEVGPEATLSSLPGLRPRLQGDASREGEGAPGGSPEAEGQGGSGGEEGSFIWVERATLSEDWEELLMEGLEGPVVTEGGGQEAWEVGRRRAEESPGAGGEESEAKPGTGRDTAVNASEGPQQPERGGEGEGAQAAEKEEEEALGVEEKGGQEMPGATEAEREGGETASGAEREGEEVSQVQRKGGEEALEAEREGGEEAETEREGGEAASGTEREGGEEALEAEREGGEAASGAEREGGEEGLGAQKTQGTEEELGSGGQRESGERTESQGEVSEAGATLGVKQEPVPGEGPRPLEEEAAQLRTPAESQGPPGDAMPLLRASPAAQQPTERQPLLQRGRPRANPSAHPAPTYAPARQPEPAAPAEGEEARGPKQKSCQCCALM
uniref:Paralemmin 3 n=1 Tax=Urocitellus parryii TaxID=9999 RepID=A0A8D2HPX4_UROPR